MRRRSQQVCGSFLSSRRRHTRSDCDWSSDVCSSDLKHIQILPYAVGTGTYRQPTVRGNPFETPSAYQRSVGADLKYGVSSSQTLDATVNPDFGQVEIGRASCRERG